MAATTLLIEDQPGETRVARLDGGRLVDLLLIHDGERSLVGNVYLGRVRTVDRGLEAAFVDLGPDGTGFLGLADARPPGRTGGRITDFAAEGDALVVQVTADPVDGKGPKLTARVTLQGRLLVLLPGQDEVRVSGRLDDVAERDRLAALAASLAGSGDGFIVRTAARGAGAEALAAEARRLAAAWRGLDGGAAAPACLHREPEAALRLLRDLDVPGARIVVDGAAMLGRVRDFCAGSAPDLTDISAHRGRDPLFEAEGVEEQAEAALSPRVALPGGGALTVQETAAVTAIDVDSGAASGQGGRAAQALATNLEAVAEAARQMRLRGLAGLVVIDPLRLKSADGRRRVLAALRAAVAADPDRVEVAGYTRLGLIELTRRRAARSLARGISVACPACAGQGRVRAPLAAAFAALRRLRREAASRPGRGLVLAAPTPVVVALEGTGAAALDATRARLGAALTLRVDDTLAPDAHRIDFED
ncbi:MAG: ribonuclease E/G [Hyphomicrobiales bacterium]|nr:ribonuclease E/G [Hyphomicrobiales bacterium]MCP5372397.1 ribonuclease E/G [Hyphomicrobiales bacterium]